MGISITVNQASFEAEVLQRSYQKPVVVDFFAHWCGPCQMLKPILEKLAQEYEIVLAKVDIDENPDLANTYDVSGVPDVRIVRDGQVSPGFVGVLPEPKIRQLLASLKLKSVVDIALDSIFEQAKQGNLELATAALENLLQAHPDNRQIMLEAADFYMQAGDLDRAEAVLAPIQDYEKDAYNAAKTCKAMIQFKRFADQPTGAGEFDLQFQTAARQILEQDYESALQGFLAIVQLNRHYRNDGARKAMLGIFDLLGDQHLLTRQYRKQLMQTLY
ncbi:MAG: tetratricopeptide repeat protein [Leptolyngbyaceae cyanobacterium]